MASLVKITIMLQPDWKHAENTKEDLPGPEDAENTMLISVTSVIEENTIHPDWIAAVEENTTKDQRHTLRTTKRSQGEIRWEQSILSRGNYLIFQLL